MPDQPHRRTFRTATAAQHYIAKQVAKGRGGLMELFTLHDDWCAGTRDQPCNCNPEFEITIGAKPTEIADNIIRSNQWLNRYKLN